MRKPHNDGCVCVECEGYVSFAEYARPGRASSKPNDICHCGDRREDHENGTGRCRMPDDLSHGFKPCKRFRLSQPAGAEERSDG